MARSAPYAGGQVRRSHRRFARHMFLEFQQPAYYPPEKATVLAGHIGVGLAISRAERRLNVGVFISAALLLDVLLWLFVLLGWESVVIPAEFAVIRQPKYVFPYSHGLLAGVLWSIMGGAIVFFSWHSRLPGKRLRAATLIGLAVFSHWLLDALVHIPELPLAGALSPRVGLGLWQHMTVALVVEALLVFIGLGLFLPGAVLRPFSKFALVVLSLVILMLSIAGMTVAPPAPSATSMAWSSLITLVAVCLLGFWFGRART